jgi:NADPH-dependent ferric siderophore reductase
MAGCCLRLESMNTDTLSRRRARRQPTKLWRVPVLRTERVTPRLARITVGGVELADFVGTGTDQNVMLYLYEPGAELPDPLTLETARGALSRVRPHMRGYTVRRHDPGTHEIDFDFVLHDHGGPASAWARRARPGDQLIFVGPSPAYQPDPAADAYLLIGDETALPAIAMILAELPAGAVARVFVEVDNAAEEQPLPTSAAAEITWLHRDGRPAGEPDLLVGALVDASLPDGTVDVWAAGERSAMQAVRDHLLKRGLDRRRVRPNTYWRRGQAGV